jgi:hypothetical protein
MEHLTLKARIRKHLWYYVSFIVLQLIGLTLVLLVAGDKPLQLTFIVVSTGIYVFWSLLHQYLHHSLTPKVAVEYVLFGLFGLTITYFIL